MRESPEVTTAVAPIYFYGTRRFLTKRGAVEAKVRDMMRGDDHREWTYDYETGYGESCDCFFCEDAGLERGGGPAFKAITRAVMRGEPVPAEYITRLPPEAASRDDS